MDQRLLSESPVFPQELIDNIVDHLSLFVLNKLSSVSRSWLDSTRRHLLHDVFVTSSRPEKSILAFAEALETNAWSFRWTRRIQICGIIPFPTLLDVLNRLPQLRTLRLDKAALSNIPNPVPPLSDSSRTLDNLTISWVDVADVNVRWEIKLHLLHLFSSITEVSIQAGPTYKEHFRQKTSPHQLEPLPAIPSKSSRTKIGSTLMLSRIGYESPDTCQSFVDNIIQSMDIGSVTILSFPLWPIACGAQYSKLLHAVSSHLTHLTLDLRGFPGRHDAGVDESSVVLWRNLRLPACTSLQALRFVFSSGDYRLHPWNNVLDALSTLPPSTSLDNITFQTTFTSGLVGMYDPSVLPIIPWGRLQEILLEFRKIGSIAFSIENWRKAKYVGVTQDRIRGLLDLVRGKMAIEFYEFGTDWGTE